MKSSCNPISIIRRRIGVSLAAGVLALGVMSPAEAKELRVHFWGGAEGDAIVKHCVKPFEERTGHKVVYEHGATSATVAKIKAQRADPEFDIVFTGVLGTYNLKRDDLIVPVDFDRIPNSKHIPDNLRSIADGYGLGWALWITTMVYNTDVVKTPPTSWNDMWDPKYEGHVVLPPAAWTDGANVVVAANILAGSDYKTNDAPGFEKLAMLKDNLLLFGENPAQVAQLFKSGDIHIGAYPIGIFVPYFKDGGYPIGIQTHQLKEGFFADPLVLQIVKNHPGDLDVIYDFLNQSVDADTCQIGVGRDIWYSPVSTAVKMTPDLEDAPGIVIGEDKLKKIIVLDYDVVAAKHPAWSEEMNRVLQK
jgi:putative spermidine/putrescine transport system substrate-binding protein